MSRFSCDRANFVNKELADSKLWSILLESCHLVAEKVILQLLPYLKAISNTYILVFKTDSY